LLNHLFLWQWAGGLLFAHTGCCCVVLKTNWRMAMGIANALFNITCKIILKINKKKIFEEFSTQ